MLKSLYHSNKTSTKHIQAWFGNTINKLFISLFGSLLPLYFFFTSFHNKQKNPACKLYPKQPYSQSNENTIIFLLAHLNGVPTKLSAFSNSSLFLRFLNSQTGHNFNNRNSEHLQGKGATNLVGIKIAEHAGQGRRGLGFSRKNRTPESFC